MAGLGCVQEEGERINLCNAPHDERVVVREEKGWRLVRDGQRASSQRVSERLNRCANARITTEDGSELRKAKEIARGCKREGVG